MKYLILAVALCATSAQAFFKDGNKLLSEINDTSPTYVPPAIALGYITGVSDALSGITHCAPTNVTAGQMRDMVQNYMQNTPAVRHLPANQIVSHVLKGVWPCKQQGNGV